MYLPNVEPVLDVLTFRYVVPHSPSELEDASPFQLISPGIYESSAAFDQVAWMPRDATELVQDSPDLIPSRIAGRGLSVTPLPTTLLQVCMEFLEGLLVVVVSGTEQIARVVKEVLLKCSHPVLHIEPESAPLNRSTLREYCLTVAAHWDAMPPMREQAAALRSALATWVDPLNEHDLGFMNHTHLLTLPNLNTLRSVGYVAREWNGKPLGGRNNEPYLAALRESVQPIIDLRQRHMEGNPSLYARSRTDLIVTVPAVIKTWIKGSRDISPSLPKQQEKIFKRVLRQIVSRKTYGLELDVLAAATPESIFSMPEVQALLSANHHDLVVYSQMLAIRAASTFSPVLRLPPSANGASVELYQLAAACRASDGDKLPKLNRLARSLSDRLAESLPGWVFQIIRQSARIKLVSDSPLEWMSVDGFPLMLRADTSRIPVTPGNSFVQQMLDCAEHPILPSAFQDVLVVRSFHKDDPLRTLLEDAVQHYGRRDVDFPHVRFVDVTNRAELVRALDEFSGAILIYDGHGIHDQSTDVGALALADQRVNPWTLRGEVRIPPIVLLSSCDTHPFDASHATVGNGFLAAGARTVLATSVPVGGTDSAVMVARLLFRVGAYLPILAKRRPWKAFRWSEVLPGLQRRQYTTEAMRSLSRAGILKSDGTAIAKAEIDVGIAIDSAADWLSLLTVRVSELVGCSPEVAREHLRRHAFFAQSLLYTQLGNPELIVGVEPVLSEPDMASSEG